VINMTGYSGTLPGLGNITVSDFFLSSWGLKLNFVTNY
jgi:hypothetical protein